MKTSTWRRGSAYTHMHACTHTKHLDESKRKKSQQGTESKIWVKEFYWRGSKGPVLLEIMRVAGEEQQKE